MDYILTDLAVAEEIYLHYEKIQIQKKKNSVFSKGRLGSLKFLLFLTNLFNQAAG